MTKYRLDIVSWSDSIRKLLGVKRSQAIPSDLTSLQRDLTQKESLSIEPDSLELGVAAGYTSHFIKEIESSLGRIENQMPTKDWFSVKLDESVVKRLDLMQSSLNELLHQAQEIPEPHRTVLTTQIQKIQAQIPLSSKMSELLTTVKTMKTVSYEDLSQRLGVKVSALRGLLSDTLKRTDLIERFRKNNKGWVRYKAAEESDLTSLQSASGLEDMLRKRFEEAASALGLKIEQRYYHASPDFVLRRNGDKIAVEIKSKADSSTLEKALGQLIYAREALLPAELWLVVPSKPSEDWIKILEASKIKVFCLTEKEFAQVQSDLQDELSSQTILFFPDESENKP